MLKKSNLIISALYFVCTVSFANAFTTTSSDPTLIKSDDNTEVNIDLALDLVEKSTYSFLENSNVSAEIVVFPIVSHGYYELFFSELTPSFTVYIYDAQGREKKFLTFENVQSTTFEIDLSDFGNGLFFMKITHPLSQETFRVIKE